MKLIQLSSLLYVLLQQRDSKKTIKRRRCVYLSEEMVLTLAERSIYTILLVAGPILILALGVGLLVSIFQATTQIQEQTLAFIPKIIAVLIGLVRSEEHTSELQSRG